MMHDVATYRRLNVVCEDRWKYNIEFIDRPQTAQAWTK